MLTRAFCMFVVCVHVPVGINGANGLSVEGLPE